MALFTESRRRWDCGTEREWNGLSRAFLKGCGEMAALSRERRIPRSLAKRHICWYVKVRGRRTSI